VCCHDIGEDYFSFLAKVPEELSHGYYCNDCFVDKISNELDSYNDTLESAKGMDVYFKKKHSRETHYFKRAPKTIVVKDCRDYDEMILRMAFLAAQLKYDTIIDIETSSCKEYDGSYKTLLWSGTALPATRIVKSFNQ